MRSIISPHLHAAIIAISVFHLLGPVVATTRTPSTSSSLVAGLRPCIKNRRSGAFVAPSTSPFFLSRHNIPKNHQNFHHGSTLVLAIRRPLASQITKQHLFWRRRKSDDSQNTSSEQILSNTPSIMSNPKDNDVEQLTKNVQKIDLSKIEKFAQENGDVLFGYIEKSQLESGNPNFGDFLDAGTGSHSLRWIASVIHREQLLENMKKENGNDASDTNEEKIQRHVTMKSYTAITADETMRKNVLKEAEELGIDTNGNVIIGNWSNGVERSGNIDPITFDNATPTSSSSNDNNSNQTQEENKKQNPKPLLLNNQQYDTILADYLVGAIDGFSPYFQDLIFHRLTPHLKPGGRLYIIGLQPIPDRAPGDANIMCKITKIRDSCILLANHRCYREYPVDWIQRHVKRAGLKLVETRTYPIRYDHATMVRQINVGRSKLRLFPSRGMAEEMKKILDRLEEESLEVTKRAAGGRITLGFDYVVVAERPLED